MSQTPKLPGYVTYVVHMGDKVSIGMKPICDRGPLMCLTDTGMWYSRARDTYYKLDSYGARWESKIRVGNKNVDKLIFVPSNILAVLTDLNEDEVTLFNHKVSNRRLEKARGLAATGNWDIHASVSSNSAKQKERLEAALQAITLYGR